MLQLVKLGVALLATQALSGCLAGAAIGTAGAVVGAGVHVTGAVVSTGVKTTGAVVGAVTPGHHRHRDHDDEETRENDGS